METELLDILLEIKQGNDTAIGIAKKIGIPRTTAANRIKKLEQQNLLIKGPKLMNKRQLILTKSGKKATTKCCRGLQEQPSKSHLYRFHHYRYKIAITKAPFNIIDRLKEDNFTVSSRSTWNAYVKEGEDDYTIEFTPKSVILHVRQLHIDDIHTGELIIRRLVNEIKKDLERRFLGLVLGSPQLVAKLKAQHIAEYSSTNTLAAYNQMFTERTGQRIQFKGESLMIDNSKGPTEAETFRKQHAGDDMIHLNEQLDFITSNRFDVAALDTAYKELKEVPEKLSRVEGTISALTKGHMDISKSTEEIRDSTIKLQKAVIALAEKQSASTRASDHNFLKVSEQLVTFGTAMEQHLTLVGALQEVAYKTRDGMETLAKQFTSAMQEMTKTQQAQSNALQAQAQAQDRQAEALLQLSKPWYIKLKESIMEVIANWKNKK